MSKASIERQRMRDSRCGPFHNAPIMTDRQALSEAELIFPEFSGKLKLKRSGGRYTLYVANYKKLIPLGTGATANEAVIIAKLGKINSANQHQQQTQGK